MLPDSHHGAQDAWVLHGGREGNHGSESFKEYVVKCCQMLVRWQRKQKEEISNHGTVAPEEGWLELQRWTEENIIVYSRRFSVNVENEVAVLTRCFVTKKDFFRKTKGL